MGPIRADATMQRVLLGAVMLAAVFAMLLSSQIAHTSDSSAAGHAPIAAAVIDQAADPTPHETPKNIVGSPADHRHSGPGEADGPAQMFESVHVLLAILSLGLVVIALRLLWIVCVRPSLATEKRSGARFAAVGAVLRPVSILDAACVLRV
ncbi:hypothetical protein ACBG85_30475 (plasmid) [Rhodococcus sp. NyZ502]|uniref:hypothetical protein n=1 Tax=unclassified Rhodococcus (in: high G+C Gram-positive bacteria) TaxID=192944 RepID=UPI002551B196|nr:hypothetical protein [Rhodococcus sp. MEB032]